LNNSFTGFSPVPAVIVHNPMFICQSMQARYVHLSSLINFIKRESLKKVKGFNFDYSNYVDIINVVLYLISDVEKAGYCSIH